jgi:hypothetical protein
MIDVDLGNRIAESLMQLFIANFGEKIGGRIRMREFKPFAKFVPQVYDVIVEETLGRLVEG